MRVTREETPARRPGKAPARSRSTDALVLLGALLLATGLGFAAHRQGWHRPLVAFATALMREPAPTLAALLHRSGLPVLTLDVRFEDYQRLAGQREQALQLGAHMATEQDFVPATARLGATPAGGEETATVLVRLPARPSAAIAAMEREHWPFEVWVDGQGGQAGLFGLYRFMLTPAGSDLLSTWGYLEALQQAGLPVARRHLVRLVVNGTSRGLYLLEELPSADLLVALGRPAGAVVCFDASALWAAHARLQGAPPGGGFRYAQVRAAPGLTGGEASLLAGDAAAAAAAALRGLQSGDLAPAQVFDSDGLSTFLALTALWRGELGPDWREMCFAYDSAGGYLLPIGSAGLGLPVDPLPPALLDAPAMQAAYVRDLARFSTPAYLAQQRRDLGPALETLRRSVAAELGYPELPWAALEARQARIRRQIDPDPALFATLDATGLALRLNLRNVQPFPLEVVGLDLGENAFLPVQLEWVNERDRTWLVQAGDWLVLRAAAGETVHPVRLSVPPEALPAGLTLSAESAGDVRVVTRLLGLEAQQVTLALPADGAAGGTP